MILEILNYKNPILRKKSEEVKEITQEVRRLALDMQETMIKNKGLGLAAPQIGKLQRIIVVQTERGPRVLINPQILKKTKEVEILEEGCLSFPGIFLKIKRPRGVEVKALDEDGGGILIKDDKFLARILQHEIDHLDGILIIDKLSFWQWFKSWKKLRDKQ